MEHFKITKKVVAQQMDEAAAEVQAEAEASNVIPKSNPAIELDIQNTQDKLLTLSRELNRLLNGSEEDSSQIPIVEQEILQLESHLETLLEIKLQTGLKCEEPNTFPLFVGIPIDTDKELQKQLSSASGRVGAMAPDYFGLEAQRPHPFTYRYYVNLHKLDVSTARKIFHYNACFARSLQYYISQLQLAAAPGTRTAKGRKKMLGVLRGMAAFIGRNHHRSQDLKPEFGGYPCSLNDVLEWLAEFPDTHSAAFQALSTLPSGLNYYASFFLGLRQMALDAAKVNF